MSDRISADEENPRRGTSSTRRPRRALITAAFGHQAKLLIPKLTAMGFHVRAVRGSTGREHEVKRLGAQEVFAADLSDVETYSKLLEGVDVVYHIGPGAHLREREMGEALIVAAKHMGVRHVVLSSVLHPIINVLQHRIKRDLEERLIESGLNFTVLKPCDFMMPENYTIPAFTAGKFPVFWPLEVERRGSLIDIDDLTDVAAKVISEGETHYDASYELAGPDKLTAHGVAHILSQVTGSKVEAIQWKPEAMLEHIFGPDTLSEAARHHLAVIQSVSNWYGQHDFVGNSNVLRWLLGRPPTSFKAFVTKAYAEFKAAQ